MTATIQDCTTDDLRTSPNSKMFLRSFWYRLVQASAVSSEEMHIYTLSRCFCHHHQLHLPAVASFLLRASLLRQSNASILELLSEALSRPLFIPVVKMCIYDGFASPTRDCSLPAVSIGLTCLDHHIAPLSITMVQWKTLCGRWHVRMYIETRLAPAAESNMLFMHSVLIISLAVQLLPPAHSFGFRVLHAASLPAGSSLAGQQPGSVWQRRLACHCSAVLSIYPRRPCKGQATDQSGASPAPTWLLTHGRGCCSPHSYTWHSLLRCTPGLECQQSTRESAQLHLACRHRPHIARSCRRKQSIMHHATCI